jgi:hypothetical protein
LRLGGLTRSVSARFHRVEHGVSPSQGDRVYARSLETNRSPSLPCHNIFGMVLVHVSNSSLIVDIPVVFDTLIMRLGPTTSLIVIHLLFHRSRVCSNKLFWSSVPAAKYSFIDSFVLVIFQIISDLVSMCNLPFRCCFVHLVRQSSVARRVSCFKLTFQTAFLLWGYVRHLQFLDDPSLHIRSRLQSTSVSGLGAPILPSAIV